MLKVVAVLVIICAVVFSIPSDNEYLNDFGELIDKVQKTFIQGQSMLFYL